MVTEPGELTVGSVWLVRRLQARKTVCRLEGTYTLESFAVGKAILQLANSVTLGKSVFP